VGLKVGMVTSSSRLSFGKKPESVARDAAWALSQLSAELRKFQSRTRKLRRPEYYIFATNVALTPVYKTGSKDKAYLRLNKVRETLAVKGFDIWDYDKLRGFLDNSEDIRRAYGAWITPGDVLAELASNLGLNQPYFDEVLTIPAEGALGRPLCESRASWAYS
jgi:hypothetical protein